MLLQLFHNLMSSKCSFDFKIQKLKGFLCKASQFTITVRCDQSNYQLTDEFDNFIVRQGRQ